MLERYVDGAEPFFLTCNFWGPHAPFLPSDEYFGLHDREAIDSWENYADPLTDKPERVKHERTDFYRSRPTTWDGGGR